jgi:hypothetical protein
MAIPQEIKDILAQSAKGLAQARFLMTDARRAAARELQRASISALRNATEAEELNDKLTALAYQILNDNVPESEYATVVAQLIGVVRQASGRASATGNEIINLMEACKDMGEVVDASVPETLLTVSAQLDAILAQIAPEPEPEPEV